MMPPTTDKNLTAGHGYPGCSGEGESLVVGLIGRKLCQLQQELLLSFFLRQVQVLTCLSCAL